MSAKRKLRTHVGKKRYRSAWITSAWPVIRPGSMPSAEITCYKPTPSLNFRPKRSGGLKQANKIAVGILDRCDEPARADSIL